jgi:hypothetical protein
MPLLDCCVVDLRGRELRDFRAGADERVDFRALARAVDRLFFVRRVEAFALGVRLDDAFAVRAGALPFRLVDPDRRAARRVLVWAMSTHLPRIATSPAVG